MLKFKVQLPDQSTMEIHVTKQSSILEVKELIQEQAKIKRNIDLLIFDNLLQDEAHVSKIIYNQETDYLVVQYSPKKNLIKLKSFFQAVVPLIQQKTSVHTSNLNKKMGFQTSDTVHENSSQKPLQRFLSFFMEAPNKMALLSKQKTLNFTDKLNAQQSIQQPSQINNNEEDLQKNNDTVLGLLDDLQKVKRQNLHKQIKSKPIKQKHSPSPQAIDYLKRKQKAEQILRDPKQTEKAKNLVHELKRQRQMLEKRRHQQHELSSELLEESLEIYKKEREDMVDKLNQEKRERIQQRLEDMQRNQEVKDALNKQSKQIISDLKQKVKKQQETIKQKDVQQQQQYMEEAKMKLQERKKLAQPIRLEDINKHAETYQENKQMLKLQREQKKIEWEIKISQETKQIYKSRKILDSVMKQDEQLKIKDVLELRMKKEQIRRKMKYAEIISEFYKNQNRQDIDQFKLSKIEQKTLLDNSQQEEFAEYLKEKESLFKQSNVASKKNSLADKIYKQKESRYDKNVKKIQNVLSQQSIPQTKVTERLKLGKLPDPSVYYQNKNPPKSISPEVQSQQEHHKYKNYLKELQDDRAIHKQSPKTAPKSFTVPKNTKKSEIIQQMRKIEEQAQRKEKLAQVKKDDNLQDEATELFLKSIQAKLAYLDQNG